MAPMDIAAEEGEAEVSFSTIPDVGEPEVSFNTTREEITPYIPGEPFHIRRMRATATSPETWKIYTRHRRHTPNGTYGHRR